MLQVPVERVVYKPPPREAISRGETYATSASYGAFPDCDDSLC